MADRVLAFTELPIAGELLINTLNLKTGEDD
jgi:hypothetical protein